MLHQLFLYVVIIIILARFISTSSLLFFSYLLYSGLITLFDLINILEHIDTGLGVICYTLYSF